MVTHFHGGKPSRFPIVCATSDLSLPRVRREGNVDPVFYVFMFTLYLCRLFRAWLKGNTLTDVIIIW